MLKRPVDQTQKGIPYGVEAHVQDRHSGGGCDRKRGGELTDHIDIFTVAGFRPLPSQVCNPCDSAMVSMEGLVMDFAWKHQVRHCCNPFPQVLYHMDQRDQPVDPHVQTRGGTERLPAPGSKLRIYVYDTQPGTSPVQIG